MKRNILILLLLFLFLSDILFAVRGPTGSTAPVLDPLVDGTSLTVVNISNTGSTQTFNTSNRKYVLQEDISTTGTAFQFWTDVNNGIGDIVIDLNGHTITYGTAAGNGVFGIRTGRSYNVRITNGTIIQGAGAGEVSHALNVGINTEIDNVTVRVSGEGSYCIRVKADTRDFGSDTGGRIHDSFLVNDNGTVYDATYGDFYECVVAMIDVYSLNIYNNVLIGGHNGVLALYTSQAQGYTASHNIHHNRFFYQTRRIGGKSPAAIHLYGINGNTVTENWITTLDARGIIVQYESGANDIYNNTIDARYTTTAAGDGYTENHLYGVWQRKGLDNDIYSNVIIGSNYTDAAADTASTAIYVGGGDPATTVQNGLLDDNFIWATTSIAGYVAKAIQADDMDDTNVISDSTLWGQDFGIHLEAACDDVEVTGNTLVNSTGVGWTAVLDENSGNVHDNTTEVFSSNATPPMSPAGIAVTACGVDNLITWNRNSETDVFQYYVYRNNERISTYPVATTFFVDRDAPDGASYEVTALNTSGVESPQGPQIIIADGKTVTGTYNAFAAAAPAGLGTYSDGSSTSQWGVADFKFKSVTDYHQLKGSPLHNTGTGTCTDFDGRASKNSCDIGAFEFWPKNWLPAILQGAAR